MPLMRPPHGFIGSYNGMPINKVASHDVLVDILQRDVECHEAEGWELFADTTLTQPATVAADPEE